MVNRSSIKEAIHESELIQSKKKAGVAELPAVRSTVLATARRFCGRDTGTGNHETRGLTDTGIRRGITIVRDF
jgi:hypothetical protein